MNSLFFLPTAIDDIDGNETGNIRNQKRSFQASVTISCLHFQSDSW